ncbi:UNVERIFIED_CONTAM: hypothetical protein HDU68_011948 [Siphonaria sp. JEL0065]|nr:hypothetical protein HDU68_011948 [Siphonaria sp. JEL0065]
MIVPALLVVLSTFVKAQQPSKACMDDLTLSPIMSSANIDLYKKVDVDCVIPGVQTPSYTDAFKTACANAVAVGGNGSGVATTSTAAVAPVATVVPLPTMPTIPAACTADLQTIVQSLSTCKISVPTSGTTVGQLQADAIACFCTDANKAAFAKLATDCVITGSTVSPADAYKSFTAQCPASKSSASGVAPVVFAAGVFAMLL